MKGISTSRVWPFTLTVRASGRPRTRGVLQEEGEEGVELETETVVYVRVLDTNDLNPLFYPTEYEETVPEDTPLHRSILKVRLKISITLKKIKKTKKLLDNCYYFSFHFHSYLTNSNILN